MMTTPAAALRRIQMLYRRAGVTLPADTKLVTRPSRWGNPFPVETSTVAGRLAAVTRWACWLAGDGPGAIVTGSTSYARRTVLTDLGELTGFSVACACPLPEYPIHPDVRPIHPDVCHGAALLWLANPGRRDQLPGSVRELVSAVPALLTVAALTQAHQPQPPVPTSPPPTD